jgi:hypothetical protein
MLKHFPQSNIAPSADSEETQIEKVDKDVENAHSPNTDPKKTASSKWQKGQSGNPAGRPRGSRNKVSLLRDYLVEGEEEQVLNKVIASALEGDTHAMALCFDRLVPRCKERSIEVEAGPIDTYEQVCAAMSKVFAAVCSGQITPSEGEKLINILKFQLEAVFGIYLRK